MRIIREDTIGLVIDIQDRLLPVMANKVSLLKNCQILIKGLQELAIPLLITQQYTKGLGETNIEIKSAVDNFTYIEKSEFSCCDTPSFAAKLSELTTKNVIICGIEAHVCVLQTAIDLKSSGYNPIIVMDCISSRLAENIKLAKERFRFESIMMTSYESLLFELTRTSSAPEFKAISKLIK